MRKKLGGIVVATKSILKNITIKDKATSRSLINALENASTQMPKDVRFLKSVKVADTEMLQKMFEAKK